MPLDSNFPFLKKLNIADPKGSANPIIIFLFISFKYSLIPARVPPVPIEHMNASTLPFNCDQISGPVVR